MRGVVLSTAPIAVALAIGASFAIRAATPDIRGAWQADTYILKSGQRHPAKGLIVFTRSEWLVLFFVTPDGKTPERGSAEGGSYTLTNNALVFTHLYNLSSGRAVEGLPESPLRMELHDAADAPTEASRVEFTGDRMTIRFPSGNSFIFRQSSRFE
jgi:hypothetical protein